MAAFDDIRRGFEAARSVVNDAIGNRAAQYLKRSLDAITPAGKPIEPVKVPPQDQIIQVPNYRTGLLGPIGWTVDAVRSALASHAGGTFVGTGLLADDFFLHPVFAKCIQERENIFSLMPRMCTAARERDKQARYVRDWFEEIRPEVYSDAILRDIHRDCLQMGFAVVGIDWEERKDGQHRWWLPVLKPWHPALVQYFYRGIGRSVDGGCFNATTLNKGLLTVEPGLGRWMLVQRGSRQPWLKGAVYSLGYDWIGDENNFFDNLAFEERFGLGVMSYYHDETYQRGQVNQSTTNIANMGAAAVIPLRMRNGTAMEKLELLATSGSGWQSFDQTEKRILTRTLLYYLGQDLTSIGQPGGLGQAQASEHKNTLWSKYEESCSWFLDGQRIVERDEQTGDEMVRWEPKEGELYKQVSKWIGWFNFRRWDIMPRVWLDATPPDQQQEREARQSKAVGEKAKTIGALAGAMETLQKVLPEVTPRQWFEASNLLPDQDAIAERQEKKKKQAPTPADEQPAEHPTDRSKTETRAGTAHDPHSGQFVSGSGNTASHLISIANAASAHAHQSNSKEAHDKAHQAHLNVLEHLKKGDALDQSKKHEALASEHKHLAAAHDASGHEKLKALANAASAHASAHNSVEAHLKAAQAHHAADPNWWEGAFHQDMAKPRVQHVPTSAADALSSSAKIHSEHVNAAKAHYAAGISGYNGRTGTLGEHYENNVIKAHTALQKAAVYPESEHGHPVHPASWAEHHYGDHISSLKENQREALRKYTHGSDQKINGALREGKVTPMVKHMDLALHTARTPEALTVTRTMATLPAGIEKGAIFSDKGYVSTTMHHSGVLYKTAHPVIMEIHIPKGSHGLPLRAVSPTHHKPEEEFLLPRDSKFHIESVEHKDGKVHIKAVVHNA